MPDRRPRIPFTSELPALLTLALLLIAASGTDDLRIQSQPGGEQAIAIELESVEPPARAPGKNSSWPLIAIALSGAASLAYLWLHHRRHPTLAPNPEPAAIRSLGKAPGFLEDLRQRERALHGSPSSVGGDVIDVESRRIDSPSDGE